MLHWKATEYWRVLESIQPRDGTASIMMCVCVCVWVCVCVCDSIAHAVGQSTSVMRARRVSLICNSLTCQVKFPLRVGCAADSAQKTPSPLRGEAPDRVPAPILQDLAENEMCFAGISLSLSLWRASQKRPTATSPTRRRPRVCRYGC